MNRRDSFLPQEWWFLNQLLLEQRRRERRLYEFEKYDQQSSLIIVTRLAKPFLIAHGVRMVSL